MTENSIDWLDRLIQEKNDLDEKIVKLYSFLKSSDNDGAEPLSDLNKSLLTRQLKIMMAYTDVLSERYNNEKENRSRVLR